MWNQITSQIAFPSENATIASSGGVARRHGRPADSPGISARTLQLAHLHDNTGDARGDLRRETMDQEVFAALGGEEMLSAWQTMAAEVAAAFPAPPSFVTGAKGAPTPNL
jgi:hypothetical protein